MVCKSICIRYKAVRKTTSTKYTGITKRCQNCEIFIDWEGTYCPCCCLKLRTKARSSKVARNKNVLRL